MAEPEELRAHLADVYGFRAERMFNLDEGVVLLRRDDGPSWVARVFGPGRPEAAVRGDAAVLDWLAAVEYPAERCAAGEPVSRLGDATVLVTEAVAAVPRAQRRSAIKDAGGIRGLGALLGRLHTLERPEAGAGRPGGGAGWPSGGAGRPGGGWHHMADGLPADELAVAESWLEDAEADASFRDLAHYSALAEALDFADACGGLPEAFTHPDFALPNVVATAEPAMVLVDWAGAGVGPRLWSLAFLLCAEGSKDLRRVELALSGYCRHVTLEPEELARLEGAICARPLVLDIWRMHNRGMGAADAARRADEVRELARAIAARARAAIARHGD